MSEVSLSELQPKPWYKKKRAWLLIIFLGFPALVAFPFTLPILILWKLPGSRRRRGVAAVLAFFISLAIYPDTESLQPQTEEVAQLEPVENSDMATQEPQAETDEAEVEIVRESVVVARVIDGDTIELADGRTLRYIGIDTPETKHPSRPVECFGQEAHQKNQELVEGRTVELEKDVSETDRFGRLLRYVYLEGVMVNQELVAAGYAQASAYPPDVKYQEIFNEAEKTARESGRGLWGAVCQSAALPPQSQPSQTQPPPTQPPTPSPTPSPTPAPASLPTPTPLPGGSSGAFNCAVKKTCGQMSSCEEAYFYLNVCGDTSRDGDQDGVPCESICPGG